jgi:hypothetical protein
LQEILLKLVPNMFDRMMEILFLKLLIPDQALRLFRNRKSVIKFRMINNELSKAQKEIRDHHTKLERILDKWMKDQEAHDEKTAHVFKVYSTHLGEALLADLREPVAANHFRSTWITLESRSKSVEISGENQKVLVKQLQNLKWKKGMQLSSLF